MSKISCLLIILMFLFAGCGGDSGSSAVPTGVPVTTYTITTVLNRLVELNTIGNTGHYEMWATVGGSVKNIQKFQITDGNIIRNLEGGEIGKLNEPFILKSSDNLRTATDIFISVEQNSSTPTQSILRGTVDNITGQVPLNPGYAIIEGGTTRLLVSSSDGNISGTYRVINNNQISFKSSAGGNLLTLEKLTSSWTYGAWLVRGGSAELIGRFNSASEAPNKTFSYNINDGSCTVMITAEPAGTQTTQPFTLLKLLYATIPSGGSENLNMNYNYTGLPVGN
ncbi:MAG: hypothetical protein ABRQ37_16180, partial [Candidatus Eremiobacterota bacterium]